MMSFHHSYPLREYPGIERTDTSSIYVCDSPHCGHQLVSTVFRRIGVDGVGVGRAYCDACAVRLGMIGGES